MSQFSESELQGMVGEALAAEHAVPEGWREAAQAAFTWRSVDEELLALTYDSLLVAGAAVRGEGDGRTLEFSGGGLTLEVELTGQRILGQLSAPSPVEVLLERAEGDSRVAATDESGFFALDGEHHGLVRFAVGGGTRRLVTEWIAL